jgi:hypothetical protein
MKDERNLGDQLENEERKLALVQDILSQCQEAVAKYELAKDIPETAKDLFDDICLQVPLVVAKAEQDPNYKIDQAVAAQLEGKRDELFKILNYEQRPVN